MATDQPPTDDVESPTLSEAELRKKAAFRAWLCPGAGFALIGKGPLALANFVLSLCMVPAVAWVAFQPAAVSAWTLIAVSSVATGLWISEQLVVRKAAIQSPSPAILDRGFIASTWVMWLAGFGAVALLAMAFAPLRMVGPGMMPTLEESERLLYHKHVDWQAVKPGAIIVYKNAEESAWGVPDWIVISRILAGPGDELSIRDGNYIVNGTDGPPVAGTGKYKPVIDVPTSPAALTVPDDCYFIVQDAPGVLDSRVLSWVRSENILGSKLWHLGRGGFFKPVE